MGLWWTAPFKDEIEDEESWRKLRMVNIRDSDGNPEGEDNVVGVIIKENFKENNQQCQRLQKLGLKILWDLKI